ncbi:Hypothetical predicted protein [Octopus vulgaris]|uniref:Uncharacterized protein n=1 Tax=Octopus vulgaris TaxID=6645 RepID=A0AA36EWI6_OCTVU|nr:Hypothetical predicted protein [Octopus vulgaris]
MWRESKQDMQVFCKFYESFFQNNSNSYVKFFLAFINDAIEQEQKRRHDATLTYSVNNFEYICGPATRIQETLCEMDLNLNGGNRFFLVYRHNYKIFALYLNKQNPQIRRPL